MRTPPPPTRPPRTFSVVLACVLLLAGAASLARAQEPGDGRLRSSETLARTPLNDGGSAGVVHAEDYPSLRAAIAALPDSAAVLDLPPGRIVLDSTLRIRRGRIHVRGGGPATHLVNRDRSGRPAIEFRPPGFAPGDDASARMERVRVSDFRISGNPESGDGIRFVGVDFLQVEGLTVDRHGEDGLHLIDTYENPRLRGNNVTYNEATGIHVQAGHDLVVADNQFEENRDGLRVRDSFNLTMSGNNLDDHLGDAVVVADTYGSVVAGNMIEESRGRAIVLQRDCYGITLSANVLAHNFGGGIALLDAWGVSVSANTFTIDAGFGLRVGPESGRVTVTGNNFSDAFVGPGLRRDDAAGGIVLQETESIAISGNVFSGLTTRAVRGSGTTEEISLTGNVFTDTPPRQHGGPASSLRPSPRGGGGKPPGDAAVATRRVPRRRA